MAEHTRYFDEFTDATQYAEFLADYDQMTIKIKRQDGQWSVRFDHPQIPGPDKCLTLKTGHGLLVRGEGWQGYLTSAGCWTNMLSMHPPQNLFR